VKAVAPRAPEVPDIPYLTRSLVHSCRPPSGRKARPMRAQN
jgi:hypothetical protein